MKVDEPNLEARRLIVHHLDALESELGFERRAIEEHQARIERARGAADGLSAKIADLRSALDVLGGPPE